MPSILPGRVYSAERGVTRGVVRDLPQAECGSLPMLQAPGETEDEPSIQGGSEMLAATNAVLWTIVSFSFVLLTLGFVLYAVVRPFTHRDHRHRSGLWVHLP
jgi:hypothetical protein